MEQKVGRKIDWSKVKAPKAPISPGPGPQSTTKKGKKVALGDTTTLSGPMARTSGPTPRREVALLAEGEVGEVLDRDRGYRRVLGDHFADLASTSIDTWSAFGRAIEQGC